MNYYEHHLGDYAKDTAHLSMLEHGAYRLLLDRYYATEKGIPADQAHRLARARTRDERDAVDAVLSEFFVLKDGVWHNGRADEEVAKAQIKIIAAQENGKKGGRPKKNPAETQNKPSGFSVGCETETQEKAHQTPDTRHQSPEEIGASRSDSTGGGSDTAAFAPTKAGQVGMALKAAGVDMTKVNLADPVFAELLKQGATVEEFAGLAREAVGSGKRNAWKWVLATLPERRRDAQQMQLAPKVEGQPQESERERRARERTAEAAGVYAGHVTKSAPGESQDPAHADDEDLIHVSRADTYAIGNR